MTRCESPHDRPPEDAGWREAGGRIWSRLGGDPADLRRLRHVRAHGLAARLPVLDLARATTGVCALAAAEYANPGARVELSDARVVAAFRSERLLRVDGRAVNGFAPLSRFWRTADGWVRTHANYPHHRARLLAALCLPDPGADSEQLVERVARTLAERDAEQVEREVFAAGGLAVAVRTPAQWRAHPQGALGAGEPLLPAPVRLDGAAPIAPQRPSRLRVLDLTRVLAGPVATRTLALLGADVLRVDPPQLPESPQTHADVGIGKRTTRLDLANGGDLRTFRELLAEAHVVVTGYRPGALDRFGLSPDALAERRAGLVVGTLNAWGEEGPWAGRRGFDSLVQAASGIALVEGDEERPGALPAQALDHGTGYLLATALLRALSAQRAGEPGSVLVRAVLARTAHALLDWPPNAPDTPGAGPGRPPGGGAPTAGDTDPEPLLLERDSPLGRLRYAAPPLVHDGGPDDWSRAPGVPGADPPCWEPR
ncbi:CoA transferase [Streptomyces sp. XM4193]|uniref:CoA transferase n=1 Tax=Streptomyces sp. XM4193 TaxID=2929782 RepID=UPI001FF7B337|nr:CoA transferase [Streptomyces sp. XM4193]MCK1797287.1 CoA transferase [Streptomyces sp. XM4193]